jgi:hypothetical protein
VGSVDLVSAAVACFGGAVRRGLDWDGRDGSILGFCIRTLQILHCRMCLDLGMMKELGIIGVDGPCRPGDEYDMRQE